MGRVITRLCTWFTQEATATCCANIRRGLKEHPIDLIYDNAPHHQGAVVAEAWVRHRLHGQPLPPYSPQMNAAEPWIGWSTEGLSAHECWQEHAALVRSFIGCVASMAKRPAEVLSRGVPDMRGFDGVEL
jgi:DDE superfamily endonuclease